jgi:hypothetical protein
VETPTQLLHRLTSYSPDQEWDVPLDDPRLRHDFPSNDLATLPWFFKRYSDALPVVALPRDLPATSAPALAVLAGSATTAEQPLDLAGLGRILYLTAGVVRTAERPYGTFLYRAAGSAGGRFPLELYVAVPEGGDLPAGVHWYHPRDHALVLVGPPPPGEATTVVVTGVPWRTGWRYRERGFRHIYWDAGTALSQLLAAAASAGMAARLFTRFPDAAVATTVGADGVHEWPVAVVALGGGEPVVRGSGPAATGEVDAAPLELPLVGPAQHAGDTDALGAPWPAGEPVELASLGDGDAPGPAHSPVEEVVLTRGSQRRMDPTRGVAQGVLRDAMTVAVRGIDVPHWVVVHAVDVMAPGLYRWPALDRPVREGEMRDQLYRICLDQGLAADAAFVVLATTDVAALDDRGYREAQLAAGLVEGRLHLAAYALGATASGMTFLDSELPAFLGEPADGLLFTCVGVGDYRSRAGGRPGEPVDIRPVVPRVRT